MAAVTGRRYKAAGEIPRPRQVPTLCVGYKADMHMLCHIFCARGACKGKLGKYRIPATPSDDEKVIFSLELDRGLLSELDPRLAGRRRFKLGFPTSKLTLNRRGVKI